MSECEWPVVLKLVLLAFLIGFKLCDVIYRYGGLRAKRPGAVRDGVR